jgi:hypothetical protein
MQRALNAVTAVTASIHDTGIVFLHTGEGRLFTANHVGARIWRGVLRTMPVEAIAAEISRDYGIDTTIALEHTTRFVDELEQQRLVQRSAR